MGGVSPETCSTLYKHGIVNSDTLLHLVVYFCVNSGDSFLYIFHVVILYINGFGGLEVACWPLVPKFAGSNPAEAVGFLRAKKSSARLPSEGK